MRYLLAGTGKTFALEAGRDAFDAAGYRVLGTAIAGKAVRELAENAHLQANTAAKLLIDFAKSPMDEAAHHAW
jgi:ATP-dependent exoDNAse (exonuclease V) alpha subunit